MAYVLALSIKLTQPNINSVALVTDVVEKVPEHYSQVFDHIISIPWFDDALESEWKIENRWKMYHVTPYEQTVLLDADMLFLSNIEHWWHYLENNHEISTILKYLLRNLDLTSLGCQQALIFHQYFC